MARTVIVVDADASIPDALRDELGIRSVPRDAEPLGETENVTQLRLAAGQAAAKPLAEACIEAAREASALLYVVSGDGYGSGANAAELAGATVAASAPAVRFVAHESGSSLMGCGWQAIAAARALAAGGDADAARAAAATVRDGVSVLALLEHPELAGAAGAPLSGGLSMSTTLRAVVAMHGAALDVIARPARREHALLLLRNQFEALASQPGGALHVAVHHAAAGPGAEALATWIRRAFDPAELVVAPITRHAATRLGPRMIGVAWYREPP